MQLTSTSIREGETIHLMHAEEGAGGQNISPQLAWSDAPEGTLSYAITIYDPDAPTGSGWWHWIAVDIPADVDNLAEGAGATMPDGSREWVTDYGYVGYGGPCPPPGPAHRYVHTVYALPFEELPVPDSATSAQVRFTILANALDSASITSLFALPEGSGDEDESGDDQK